MERARGLRGGPERPPVSVARAEEREKGGGERVVGERGRNRWRGGSKE